MLQVNTALPLRVLSEAVAAGCPLFVYADTALRNVANAYSLSKRQFAEWANSSQRKPGSASSTFDWSTCMVRRR